MQPFELRPEPPWQERELYRICDWNNFFLYANYTYAMSGYYVCKECNTMRLFEIGNIINHVRDKHGVEVKPGNCTVPTAPHYAYCNEYKCQRANGHGRRLVSDDHIIQHLRENHGIIIADFEEVEPIVAEPTATKPAVAKPAVDIVQESDATDKPHEGASFGWMLYGPIAVSALYIISTMCKRKMLVK